MCCELGCRSFHLETERIEIHPSCTGTSLVIGLFCYVEKYISYRGRILHGKCIRLVLSQRQLPAS